MANRPQYNQKKLESMGTGLFVSPLAKALKEYCLPGNGEETLRKFYDELTKSLKKAPDQIESVEKFLTPKLLKAIKELGGKQMAANIEELVKIAVKGNFSRSMARKSYRSSFFGFYGVEVVRLLRGYVQMHCYDNTWEEMLSMDTEYILGCADCFALEINRKNPVFIHTIKDMILGDNNVLLSRTVIEAVIRSDDQELKELLLKLLLAAKGQEGLRQAVLESADSGSHETFLMIYKCCLDNDLFRFSSAARALYAWSGLYMEEIDITETRKLAELGYTCLTDLNKRKGYLDSRNPFEIYMALWARGCEEIKDTDQMAEKFLSSPERHKKLIGWHFVYNVENAAFRHNRAAEHLDEEELALVAYVTDNLHVNHYATYTSLYDKKDFGPKTYVDTIYPEKLSERKELFYKLKPIAKRIGHQEWRINGVPFSFSRLIINQDKANVMRCMFSLTAYDLDSELIDALYGLRDLMTTDLRMVFYAKYLDPDHNEKHREYLYEGLKDKSVTNKIVAVERLKKSEHRPEDLQRVAALFSSKSADLKKAVISYFMELPEALKFQAADLLLTGREGGKEGMLQGALELLLADEKLLKAKASKLSDIDAASLSDQTRVLFDQLTGKGEKQEAEAEEKLYGLIDPKLVEEVLNSEHGRPTCTVLTEKQMLGSFPKQNEVDALLEDMDAIFKAHADYEYEVENYDGSREKVLFGNIQGVFSKIQIPAGFGNSSKLVQNGEARLYMVPFHEEFEEALKKHFPDPVKVVLLNHMFRNAGKIRCLPWFEPWRDKWSFEAYNRAREKYGYTADRFRQIIYYAFLEVDPTVSFDTLFSYYVSLIKLFGEDKLKEPYREKMRYEVKPEIAGKTLVFQSFPRMIGQLSLTDEQFKEWFLFEYRLERRSNYVFAENLAMPEYIRALSLSLIPEDCVCDWVLHPDANRYAFGMQVLTSNRLMISKELRDKYDFFSALAKKVVDKTVTFEAKRGQAETPISGKLRGIERFEGMEYFCMLLKALGNDTFFRGYEWSGATTKVAVLSMLLRKCQPGKTDTAKGLKELLTKSKIKEKRLVEAAMYAPQWAGFLEEVTGIKGLKKGVWFFHAHVSENFSSDKETEVAIYSPISPMEFNDGAFDINWFKACYEELGEKQFKVLYNCAKYITNGSNAHRRSQLYADAVSGKLSAKELEAEIKEKRNQERLRAYALIPLGEGDLLRRYDFICNYIKESRQFGAQRRESEKKAANVAIQNLSISSGYFDVNRMLWKLESAKNESILPMLEKKEFDGYEVSLVLSEEGDASVFVEKGGKALKSAPKTLSKNEYLESLKHAAKELKEQKVRGRRTLEECMENRTEFSVEELSGMFASLTIAPMAKKLLFVWGDKIGFLDREQSSVDVRPAAAGSSAIVPSAAGYAAIAPSAAGSLEGGFSVAGSPAAGQEKAEGFTLTDQDGVIHQVPADALLTIAHPHNLFEKGCLADFMHLIYKNEIRQPFKQVFREYYPLTAEEKEEVTLSRRYAGYQVQPKKTVALLKQRGWTVDYEEGLQKVCYGDNLIVRMYAAADWFSPADIEAPTLEILEIYDRKTGKKVALDSVNPILYSEIMRDIDLVVSVAYVGGVDPESSHSTVEMRIALAKELTALMKLSNVEYTERHARIHGKLSDYSVHMGSGIVHAGDKGMIPILPVHSSHRGRVFLPFVDEDPKTAEIMSKIILLAEDTKIKDPEILRRLQ